MFEAMINVPGYLPTSNEPWLFDTAAEAWGFLAAERERDEDSCEDWPGDNGLGEYSSTWVELNHLATAQEHGNPFEDNPTALNGAGVIYGATPGYQGDHDLGLAYSVREV